MTGADLEFEAAVVEAQELASAIRRLTQHEAPATVVMAFCLAIREMDEGGQLAAFALEILLHGVRDGRHD